ncbi:hypothetical protein D3C87_1617770 [compost metagenome]
MIIGHHETAGAGGRGDGHRDAALAGRQDGREIALVGTDQLGLADRLARKEFETRDGAGQLGRGIGHGGDRDIFGAQRALRPVLPFDALGVEAFADADRRLGDQDLGLGLLDDLGDRRTGRCGRPAPSGDQKGGQRPGHQGYQQQDNTRRSHDLLRLCQSGGHSLQTAGHSIHSLSHRWHG